MNPTLISRNVSGNPSPKSTATSCPFIDALLEGPGAIALTEQEHNGVVQAMRLKWQMENLERQHIYFRGHTDAFAYLKEIGAI